MYREHGCAGMGGGIAAGHHVFDINVARGEEIGQVIDDGKKQYCDYENSEQIF